MPVDPSPESPLFPGRIDADRLELRVLSPGTADPFEFYAHTGSDAPHVETITEYLPWDPNPTVEAALEHLETCADGFREGDRCSYLIRPRDDEPAPDYDDPEAHRPPDPGWVGTATLEFDWDRRSCEFGVWLRKPYWGRGYAVESGGALLAVAFERLDLELVEIQHEDGNEASRSMIQSLVERFGGRYEGLLRNDKPGTDGPRDMHRFTTSAAEYREATGGDRVVDPRADPVVIDE
jgi:RimJ/RimL family protein N-acetyltransferase